MNSQSINSISFVINAAYTFTFANAIFLITTDNPSAGFNVNTISFTLERSLCGIICLIMTLRFFFGNNQYIADVMADSTRTAWQKFYQFSFIAIQSIILLISSYSINDTIFFISSIAILFLVENLWYVLTYFVDSVGIKNDDGTIDQKFFLAQLINAVYWVGSFIILHYCSSNPTLALILVFVLFIANTVWDAKKNMPYYMSAS